jgi:methionyl-tRNA formyltransferase
MGKSLDLPPLVFFGTGPVAARSLELLAKNFRIEAVVTKPRPAHHKGDAPVLKVAERLKVTVLTAINRQELDTLFNKKPVSSKLAVLIDFGIIISQAVIDYFPLGIINSHFSILPDLRGADPITFAILSGQPQTGVSLMYMVKALDEGPLLGYGEYTLPPDITTPELTEILIDLSDTLLQHELPRVFTGEAKRAPQDVTRRQVSYSRRLTKEDGRIDWEKPAEVLEREIRAFLGWPGSRTQLGNKEVTITKAHVVASELAPGAIETTKKTLVVGTGQQGLSLERLKPAGKTEMSVQAFLAGYGNRPL